MDNRTSKRQAIVTDEHRDESAKLKALWLRRKKELAEVGTPLTQEAFGADFDIGNQAAVWQFLNGKAALSFKAASGFAKGLGCKISDFSPRLAALGEIGPPEGQSDEALDEAFERVRALGPELRAKVQGFLAGVLAAAEVPPPPISEEEKEARKKPFFPPAPKS